MKMKIGKVRAANMVALPVLRKGSAVKWSTAFAVALILPANQLLAESHGGSDAHHGPSLTLLLINFIIYVSLVWALLRKTVSRLWVSRSERIRESIERSQALLKDAEKAHAQAVEDEAALSARLEELRAERLTSAHEEARELVAAARERASRLLEQASQLAEAERTRDLDAIRREFSQAVIARAEEIIRHGLSDENDQRMRATALSSVEGLALLSD